MALATAACDIMDLRGIEKAKSGMNERTDGDSEGEVTRNSDKEARTLRSNYIKS